MVEMVVGTQAPGPSVRQARPLQYVCRVYESDETGALRLFAAVVGWEAAAPALGGVEDRRGPIN